jgi:hypothetical protein
MCDGGLCGDGFSTLSNTIGVGDPIPAGINTLGSGDKWCQVGGVATKGNSKTKKTKKEKQPNYGEMLPTIVYLK